MMQEALAMMNEQAALTEARRLWGRDARVRYNKKALTDEAKLPLRSRLAELRAQADPATKAERSELSGRIVTYRCELMVVSRAAGLAIGHVRGWGDTWEEAFKRAAE